MLELLDRFLFPTECLDDTDTRDGFLDLSVEFTQNFLLLGKELAGVGGNDTGQNEDQHHADERYPGQYPAEREHDTEDAQNGESIGQKLGQGVGNGRADVVHIVGQTAHEFTVLPPVEKGERQGFHDGKERGANVVHDALTDRCHEKLLEKARQPVTQIQSEQQQQQRERRTATVDGRDRATDDKRGEDGGGGGQSGQQQNPAQTLPAAAGQIP